jgi:hypothetical protein
MLEKGSQPKQTHETKPCQTEDGRVYRVGFVDSRVNGVVVLAGGAPSGDFTAKSENLPSHLFHSTEASRARISDVVERQQREVSVAGQH